MTEGDRGGDGDPDRSQSVGKLCRADRTICGSGVRCKVDNAELKAAYWRIFNDIEAQPGEEAIAVATRRADDFAAAERSVRTASTARG